MNAPAEKPGRSRFVVSESKALTALHWWLSDRQYNNHWPYLYDKDGHRMIGLNWRTFDAQGRENLDPRGLVLIKDLQLSEQVIMLVEEHMSEDK